MEKILPRTWPLPVPRALVHAAKTIRADASLTLTLSTKESMADMKRVRTNQGRLGVWPICNSDPIIRAYQSQVIASATETLHVNLTIMTTELSLRILNLAASTRQMEALKNAADILHPIRQHSLKPVSVVQNALSLSIVAVNSSKSVVHSLSVNDTHGMIPH